MKPAATPAFERARNGRYNPLEAAMQGCFKTPFPSPTLATLRARRPAPAAPLFPGK
jgi:hypothetical protein